VQIANLQYRKSVKGRRKHRFDDVVPQLNVFGVPAPDLIHANNTERRSDSWGGDPQPKDGYSILPEISFAVLQFHTPSGAFQAKTHL
jgi:hypothetical protein